MEITLVLSAIMLIIILIAHFVEEWIDDKKKAERMNASIDKLLERINK